jgi:hypothetical protein
VMCVEPPQDIPAEAEPTLVRNIARHACQWIVLSSGRPMSHWLDLFASDGWHPCLFDSLALQSLSTFPWFRSSLVVLMRDSADAGMARERLSELEQQPTKRNKQRPAVIAHSFTEEEGKLLAHRDSPAVAAANVWLRALISRMWK